MLKQTLALVGLTVSLSVNAATVTFNVTGVLGDWYAKIFSDPVVYQTFLEGNPDINVQGVVEFDDVLEEISYLSLEQVGTLSATVNDGDNDTQMSLSGLSWELTQAYDTIYQTGGTATCSGPSLACSAVAVSINGALSNSPFEFDGVQRGFKVGGVRQVSKDSYIETFDNATQIFIDVYADQAYVNDPAFNSAHNSLFELTAVPVPAAAWLFGSALVGLAGIKRKK